ncbi:MAG: M36 family metallopeptidase [Chitinophagaceae bacterium]|nr:M36 family metallopeptidase [Chitinophagaceae bacterium]
MKRILLLVTIIFAAFICHAQVSDADAAKALQLVSASKSDIGLSEKDLSQVKVTTSYFDRSTGLTMVYLQQTYAGIPILKQILPLAFKDGKLVSKAGAFEHSMDQLVDVKSGIPAVSASSAVQFAIADRKLTSSKIPLVISTKENGRKIEYNDMGVSHENITAELLWVPYEESIKKGNTVSTVTRMRLAWQVYIIQTTSSDYWLVCVDAMDNKTLRVDNLTVYDHWGHPSDTKPGTTPALINGTSKPGEPGNAPFGTKNIFTASGQTPNSPTVVNNSSYRVIPYPAESPNIAGPAVRTNPWLAAPGNATTLGWHTGLAAAEFDYTRGNNVWAYQDRVAPSNTGTIAKSASSTTTLPDLTFDFVPNFTVDPLQEAPVPNKQFNVTNLFYWNNIIHDVMYQYGFDEPAHNFQDDNLGRGGVGNDHVNAEAQDASGTNNANFSTPNDGGSGRMQMFLWNLNGVNPIRDGDVDNGIIVHEYGHGISIRLTGGGATVCLSGAEQMGEGWSDYYGLMFTTNWATASVNDGFNIPRHIGNYALNNVSIFTCPYPAPIPPCTATPNLGIRHFPYSTNMAVNPWVYATVIPSSVHDRGEIWAATLWDMTWKLIQTRGISPNLYDATATGGNVVAMRLVTLGLKLQPCSVGFVDGRNAILAADQALYGGANQCLIWEAFARRGMGFSASQGNSTSVTDQTPAFDLAPACLTTPFIVSAGSAITAETCSPPNSAIDPNETVTVDLTLSNSSPINSANLVATLQATGGVTSPSGPQNYGVVAIGAPVTRSFSFTAGNLACGQQLTATLQLQDGATNLGTVTYTFTIGADVITISENFDGVTAPALPAGWVATNVTGAAPLWVTSSAGVPSPVAISAPNSIFIDDPSVATDKQIVTPTFTPGATDKLSFANNFSFESGYDGGVLEISINGGAFTDIITAGGSFVTGGYTGTISASFGSPIAGRQAWTGTSPGGFITTTVNLPAAAAGMPCQLKFRMGSDNSVAGVGWRVDNLTISTRVCCTNNCTPPVITAPTVTQPTCTTPTGTIVVNATGNGTLEYSVDNGATYQASATFSGLVTGNYNIKVRLQASPTCESAYTSNPVVINPAPPAPVATLSAVPAIVCNGGITKIYLNVSGGTGPFTVTIQTSQGQSTTRTMNNGDFVELGPISTGILNVFISSGTDANGCSLDVTNSNVTVTGIANPTAVATPSSQTSCSGSPIATIVLSGTGTVYNWTRDNTAAVTGITASGAGDISGTLTNTTAAPVTVTFTITPTANGCEGTAITATVTVYPSPVITAPTVTQPTCLVPTGTIVVNATGSGTLEYSVDNGSTYQASATFSGLATGNYNIKVRLQSSPSCEAAYANNPVVITAATGCCVPPVITSPTVTQPTCLVPTGTIVVNATGNSPLEYSVDNGASWQPSATFSGLAPSNYYIISVRHISDPTCGSTYGGNPVVLHATELPIVGMSADGPLTFCAGGSVNLGAVVIYPNFLRMVLPYNIDFSIGTAVFGPSIITTPLNGDFVYIPDGTASYLGCNPYAPGSLNGKIALIDRGICPFVYKAKNAQDAGAIGVVIVNNVAGGL